MSFNHFMRDPVLTILALASLVSWVIIFSRVLGIRRSMRADAALLPGDLRADAPLGQLRQEMQRHDGAGRDYLITVLDTAIQKQRRRLEGMLPLLGVIGSTAPYLGLLGTVIGIIQAFQAIQVSNNMSPSTVSGGISASLIATATGLAVAIPAVAAHHLLSAAIAKRAEAWEESLAVMLPDPDRKEERYESIAQAER
jgi:biopolymer transport protein ExbB/TolQ